MSNDERYLHALQGSELEEALVAGGVIADGSVEHALKGKQYKRGLRCLRLMYEVQGSLAFDLADETKENLKILRDMSQSQESRDDVHAALQDDVKLESLVTNVFNLVEASDMADYYWRNFLTMSDALMQSVSATGTSMSALCMSWRIAYDNIRYERWLPDFWAMLFSPLQTTLAPIWPGTCGLSVP